MSDETTFTPTHTTKEHADAMFALVRHYEAIDGGTPATSWGEVHDYTDANMVMLEAFAKLEGLDETTATRWILASDMTFINQTLDEASAKLGEDSDRNDIVVRTAIVRTLEPLEYDDARELLDRVRAYMPSNYGVTLSTSDNLTFKVRITGTDSHGWTLDGYVIPRLASGNMFATEIKEEQ